MGCMLTILCDTAANDDFMSTQDLIAKGKAIQDETKESGGRIIKAVNDTIEVCRFKRASPFKLSHAPLKIILSGWNRDQREITRTKGEARRSL
jgi:hypothetical protein